MTAYINKLKDVNSNQQLPITHERAVRDDNGTTAETKFQNLEGAMDKAYVANSDNGMGRITLHKNMVSGVNTLTQSMMQATNTIYVIRYDFTLGEDITVPANCVLEFDGGSISGAYAITGQDTGIEAGLVKIFNTDVTLAGTWNVTEAYPEWFDAKGDGVTDDRKCIQTAIDVCREGGTVHLQNRIYYIGFLPTTPTTTNFLIYKSINIIGNNTKFLRNSTSHVCFRCSLKETIRTFFSANITAGETIITVEDASSFNIGDNVFLRGEDSATQDRNECINFMFNEITNISGNSITLKNPIPFNVRLQYCNQQGTISSASYNGTIYIAPKRNITISNITDVSDFRIAGPFITINRNNGNVYINNIQSANQCAINCQYCENVVGNNITTITETDKCQDHKEAISVWECKNCLFSNIKHYKKGTPKSSFVTILEEGNCSNIIVNNLYIIVKQEHQDTTTNSAVCGLGEGCQLLINNLYIEDVKNGYQHLMINYGPQSAVSLISCEVHNITVNLGANVNNILPLLNPRNKDVLITGNITFKFGDNSGYNKSNVIINSDNEFIIKDRVYYKTGNTPFSLNAIKFKNCWIKKVIIRSNTDINGVKGYFISEDYSNNISFNYGNIEQNKTYIHYPNALKYNINFIKVDYDAANADGYLDIEYHINKLISENVESFLRVINKVQNGTSTNRPTKIPVGFRYFDETLGKPIWWNGTAWVDATGATV